MEFRYLDKVEVTRPFYAWFTGEVIAIDEYQGEFAIKYFVKFDKDWSTHWFKPSELKSV